MLYRHVFGRTSSEFCGISRVFVNFVDTPEFRCSAAAQNIRSPEEVTHAMDEICFGCSQDLQCSIYQKVNSRQGGVLEIKGSNSNL